MRLLHRGHDHAGASVPSEEGVIIPRGADGFGLFVADHGLAQGLVSLEFRSRPAPVELRLPLGAASPPRLRDLLSDEEWEMADPFSLTLPPYGAAVLAEDGTVRSGRQRGQ